MASVFAVAGAGDGGFNGEYADDGQRDGKVCYRRLEGGTLYGRGPETIHFSAGAMWVMSRDYGDAVYQVHSRTDRPPVTGWQVLERGSSQVPSVRYPTYPERQEAELFHRAQVAAEAKRLADEEYARKQAAKRAAAEAEARRLAAEAEARRLPAEAEAARLQAIADRKAAIARARAKRASEDGARAATAAKFLSAHQRSRDRNRESFLQTSAFLATTRAFS